MSNHAEHSALVQAPIESVFAWLDDQSRLAQHMSKRSWRMGWGKMEVQLDSKLGRAVGSHIVFRGRILGISLCLDEVVIEHEPPFKKTWKTVGEPRLLVVGPYRMGFDLERMDLTTKLRVSIDFLFPVRGMPHLFGKMFAGMYARWCVRQMAEDAQRSFNG